MQNGAADKAEQGRLDTQSGFQPQNPVLRTELRAGSGAGRESICLFFFFQAKTKTTPPPNPEFNSSPVKGRSASATYNLKTKKKGRRGWDTKLNKVFFSIPRTALQGLFLHSQTPSVL